MNNKKITSINWLLGFILITNLFNIIVRIVFYEDIFDTIAIVINALSFVVLIAGLFFSKIYSYKYYSYVYGDKFYKYGYDILSKEKKLLKSRKIRNRIINRQSTDGVENVYLFKNEDIYLKFSLINLLGNRKLVTFYHVKVTNKKLNIDDDLLSIENNFQEAKNNCKIEDLVIEDGEVVPVSETSAFVITKANHLFIVNLYTYYVTNGLSYIDKNFNKSPSRWEMDYEFDTKEFTTVEDAKKFITEFIEADCFYRES